MIGRRIKSGLARLATCGVLAVAVGLPLSPPQAEIDPLEAPMEVVVFGEADTLRDIVGKYLQDPDLWPTILSLNNIASPADLVPGMELHMPVRQVLAADDALRRSLNAIQRATAEGARIFAPVEIGNAIANRDTAVLRREDGEWREVVNFAGLATEQANKALDISLAQRDRLAEAVISDVQGTVEGRSPVEQNWSNRKLNDILVEFERLRTLSNSTTQVTFRDLSRLRLNPNSNATIQRMRSDPLTGGEVTKVSLANGNFYALLNQLTEKTAFEIDLPGIETKTNSSEFWIKNDATGARFVNYDDAGLEIAHDGERYLLGENQGVVLSSARKAERTQVLASPLPLSPAEGDVIYTGSAALSWASYDGAAAYWVEVARDPGFNEMQVSQWGILDTRFLASELPPARYYWRVAALDQLGLPGQWSLPRDFTLRTDQTPPFLTLLSPAPDSIQTSPQVEVLGASEMGASLVLNGVPVRMSNDGSFLANLPLKVGSNQIAVKAIDPAGNTSSRSIEVVYRPKTAVDIVLSDSIPRVDGALATRSEDMLVTAQSTAEPGAMVVVRDSSDSVVVQTLVGDDRGVTFTVPVDAAERTYEVHIVSPTGEIEGQIGFGAVRDQTPPKVAFDLPPPRATGDGQVRISGTADDAVSLMLEGALIPLAEGRFDLDVALQPGENAFQLIATDAVGNLGVAQFSTLLDVEPPKIEQVDLYRDGQDGPIELLVRASDASGLRQAATFVVALDGEEINGFLRCDSASGICRASLPAQNGALELVEIVIEDYAGNAAFN